MKVMTINNSTFSKSKEIYELLLKCSDETDFLACSASERIQSGFTLNKFREFLSSTSTSDNEFFICIYEGGIIGMLGLHNETHQRFSHRISLGMNVLKEFWGMGAGSLLIKSAISYFHSKDHLTKLELEVRADNDQTISLYKKHGFEIEGELKNHFYIDSQYYSVYKMCLIK